MLWLREAAKYLRSSERLARILSKALRLGLNVTEEDESKSLKKEKKRSKTELYKSIYKSI